MVFLKAFQWTLRMQLRQSCRKKISGRPKLLPPSPKVTKRSQHFEKQQLSWKCFSGLVKCKFEIHVKTFFRPNPTKIRPLFENDKKNSEDPFLLNLYLCSRRNDFGKPRPKMFDRCPKFFQSATENVNKLYFFPRKKDSLKLFFRKSRRQFWQSCRNSIARRPKLFYHNGETFSLNVREDAKTTKFLKTYVYPQPVFLWTRRKQFWQTRPESFLNQFLKTLENLYFSPSESNISSNFSSGQIEGSFDNTAETK